ncbi:MAG: rRNA maturation RNase YbeY [Nannocystaceae bacterium]
MTVRLQVDAAVAPWLDPALRRRLQATLARLVRAAGCRHAAAAGLGVRIVGDAEMIALHREHMGEATPTDVLSFPADPVLDPGLGDIAIDWDQLRRQAPGVGAAAWFAEAQQLLVHALAHLCGHDHGSRAQARAMLRFEQRIARRAGIARPQRSYGATTGGVRWSR